MNQQIQTYTIEQAVEHLKNGGAIEFDNKELLNFLKYILLRSYPETEFTDVKGIMPYYLEYEGDWYGFGHLPNNTDCIKLSQITKPEVSTFDESKVEESENPNPDYFRSQMYKAFQHGRAFVSSGLGGDISENCPEDNLPFAEWFNKYYKK